MIPGAWFVVRVLQMVPGSHTHLGHSQDSAPACHFHPGVVRDLRFARTSIPEDFIFWFRQGEGWFDICIADARLTYLAFILYIFWYTCF